MTTTRSTQRPRRDRGDTSLEIALYTPLLLLAVLAVIQAAVWGLADLAARHAADHAVQTARVAGATATDGETAATALLADINPRGLTNVEVTVTRGTVTTTAEVSGHALQLIPGITMPVNARVTAPTEP